MTDSNTIKHVGTPRTSNGVKAAVYTPNGAQTETVELNPKIFGLEKVSKDLVHQVVVSMLSSKRGPVANTKTRGEVRGGGKKPWQQKGTGRARAGSSRSPLWVGGGITFGPRSNRNWERKINKKSKTQVLFSILTDKAKSDQLVIVDDFTLSAPKTRELAAKIKDLRAKFPKLGRNLLMIITDGKSNIFQAGKNLPNVNLKTPMNLNILDLISVQGLIVMKDALPIIEKTYLKAK